MKTFVISLPEAKERQAHMTDVMAGCGPDGLAFEFFEAIDGREFDVANHPQHNTFKRRLYFGRDLRGGELGVLLSHRAIYQKMIAENIAMAFVLEDDVTLHEDCYRILKALENGPQDFDLVRFLGSAKVARLQQYPKRVIDGDYTLNRLCTTPGGAHAYVITKAGAAKMLKCLNRSYLPIDTLMGHVWTTGLKAYIVQPGLSLPDETQPQYIGTARFDKTIKLKGILRFVYPLGRAWFKITEGVLKRVFYYKDYVLHFFPSSWGEDQGGR